MYGRAQAVGKSTMDMAADMCDMDDGDMPEAPPTFGPRLVAFWRFKEPGTFRLLAQVRGSGVGGGGGAVRDASWASCSGNVGASLRVRPPCRPCAPAGGCCCRSGPCTSEQQVQRLLRARHDDTLSAFGNESQQLERAARQLAHSRNAADTLRRAGGAAGGAAVPVRGLGSAHAEPSSEWRQRAAAQPIEQQAEGRPAQAEAHGREAVAAPLGHCAQRDQGVGPALRPGARPGDPWQEEPIQRVHARSSAARCSRACCTIATRRAPLACATRPPLVAFASRRRWASRWRWTSCCWASTAAATCTTSWTPPSWTSCCRRTTSTTRCAPPSATRACRPPSARRSPRSTCPSGTTRR